MTGHGKIYNYTADGEKLRQLLNGKITLVGGCFDILHFGHLTFLEKARQPGELLVIALEPDEFIRQKKGKTPVHTQEQRAAILSHIDIIDAVLLLPMLTSDTDYDQLVMNVHPATIVSTKGDRNRAQKETQAAHCGARFLEVDVVTGFSSSAIKQYAALSGD